MDRLLTPQQAADLLGVKKSTIYQWTSQGFIPYLKLRNLVRFRGKDLEEWVQKRICSGRCQRRIDIDQLLD